MTIDPRIAPVLAEHPYPLLFATVSGAHLYGFPSPDSDYDLRGVHLLPLEALVGLRTPNETHELMEVRDGLEIDLVTHEARKFFSLLLKRNGYVLEQLYSPLVLQGGAALEELRAIARGCITRHHVHHYRGFAHNQWALFEKESPRRVKPLLYVFRVLLTGIHLMREGEVEANLVTLNRHFQLDYLDSLIARKLAGPEHGTVSNLEVDRLFGEFQRLLAVLEEAFEASTLPVAPAAEPALHDFLLRLRRVPAPLVG